MRYLTTAIAVVGLAACAPANDSDALGEADAAMQEAVMSEAADKARDGPFGFDIGQPIDEVRGAEKIDAPGLYRVNSPPKPHSDFEVVILEAYPSTGICTIRAIGKDLVGDGAGISIRGKVDSLSEALATKYGQPRKLDRCAADRIKCQDRFWMMTLDDNERAYAYMWEKPNEAMKAANIGELGVGASASNIQDTYPVIEFYSADVRACDAARNASSADAL